MENSVSKLFDISGKIALITGSGRGIGIGYARGYLDAGATVILNDIVEERLENTLKMFREEGYENVYGYRFDVTDEEDVVANVDKIEEEVGPIDILINNAGIQRRIPMVDFDIATFREVIDTNLTSAFIVGRAVAKKMIPRGHGKIINITSLNAILARENICAYSSAKGGLVMLTKSMALEWGPKGICVNSIGPGYIATELTQPLVDDPEFDAWVKSEIPLKRWGSPEDIVGTAIFLAAPASDYINGFVIYVDGGWQCCL